MASNLMWEKDAADNWKPSKKSSREKIDGMSALIMALGVALALAGTGGAEHRGRASLRRWSTRMTRALAFVLLLGAWGLLAYGAWLVYAPAGWVVLGACLWIDLYLGDRLRRLR